MLTKSLVVSAVVVLQLYSLQLSQQEDLAASKARGEVIYGRSCSSCHMSDGKGMAGTFPPLAQADYLLEDPERAVHIILHGQAEEIVVNGETYDMPMPAQAHLDDQEVADVMNYILNSWGNDGGTMSAKKVKEIRNRP